VSTPAAAAAILETITAEFREEVEALYLGARLQSTSPGDASKARQAVAEEFSARWGNLSVRLSLVPGKRAFSRLVDYCQEGFGFSLSKTSVLAAYHRADVPFEIAQLLRELDAFRQMPA
jgi:hypothetical protein